MKKLIVLLLVFVMLVACAGASILLARGWFTLRTAGGVPPTPVVEVFPATPIPSAATPTPAAALPPAQATISASGATGGFNGTFAGTLSADNGSSAPATLVLTQTGGAVTGRLAIGEGLSLDAGNCGVQAVPAGEQNASGTVDPANPNRLTAAGNIPVSGFTIGVALTAELPAAGDGLSTRVDLELPFLCGRDAAITGTFTRQ